MKNNEIINLLKPSVEALGYGLWGVEYLPQGKHSILRVYIDKADGIGIEDCEQVSRQVSTLLDVENPIKGHYSLEVSSPGLDRPLFEKAHFEQFVGEAVRLKISQPVENKRKFFGHIERIENETVVLKVDGESISIPLDNVVKANLVS